MNKQMCDDLVKVLQVAQPRTLIGTNELLNYYKKAVKTGHEQDEVKDTKIKRNSGISAYGMNTSIEFEVDKSIVDLNESLEAAKKLPEYKRIEEDKYDKEKDLIEIPLDNITKDLKDSRMNSVNFENHRHCTAGRSLSDPFHPFSASVCAVSSSKSIICCVFTTSSFK